MGAQDILAQGISVLGMALAIYSFQCKKNRVFFVFQALSGLMFFVSFAMIGAVSAALCNAANVIRGALLSKSDRKMWKLVVTLGIFLFCMLVSLLTVWGNTKQVLLTMLTIVSSLCGTCAMWTGNGATIRKTQFFCNSPLWLIHNCFNFSLGGILCEVFNLISVIISFIRYGKEGFEK